MSECFVKTLNIVDECAADDKKRKEKNVRCNENSLTLKIIIDFVKKPKQQQQIRIQKLKHRLTSFTIAFEKHSTGKFHWTQRGDIR